MSDQLNDNAHTVYRLKVTGLLVILLLATLVLAPACNKSAAGSTGGKSAGKSIRGFTMVNETFPGEKFHVHPIRSSRPGELFFYCRGRYGDGAGRNFDKEIKGYRANAGGELEPVAADFGRSDLDAIIEILPAGFLQVVNCGGGERRDLYYSTMTSRGGGAQCVFYAKDRDWGKDRLIGQTEFLPMIYSEETGAVLVDLDGYGGARVKTIEADCSSEGMQLMEVRAWGRGFYGGELVQALVTADGKVYRFGPREVRFTEEAGLAWLKRVLEVPAVRDNKADPLEFAFTGGVLAIDDGTECVLLTSGGATGRLDKRDVLTKTPAGRKRDEKELKQIAMDHLALRPEAYKIGTECLSEHIKVVPVDGTRVAVYDHDYQRLVFIASK